MFNRQTGKLDALEGKVDGELLATLRELLGNPGQALHHDGEVHLPGLDILPDNTEHGGGSTLHVTGRMEGFIRYSKAQEAARQVYNAKLDAYEWWVACRDCDDRYGWNERGPTFDVLVQTTGSKQPAIDAGNVVQYHEEIDDAKAGTWLKSCHNHYQKDADEESSSSSDEGLP